MTFNIVSVNGSDGSALYINGMLLSDHFTNGENNIIKALGHTAINVEADEAWFQEIAGQYPERIEDCVLVTPNALLQEKHNHRFNLYDEEPFSHIELKSLEQDTLVFARIEKSAPEGFIVEVAKYDLDFGWYKYAHLKLFDLSEAQTLCGYINHGFNGNKEINFNALIYKLPSQKMLLINAAIEDSIPVPNHVSKQAAYTALTDVFDSLKGLIDTADLDFESAAKSDLETFDSACWNAKDRIDMELYDTLLLKGDRSELSYAEFVTLCELSSVSQGSTLSLKIFHANNLIQQHEYLRDDQ